MFSLVFCLLLGADDLTFDPNAKPVPEIVDLMDADGDGMILDAEFAAAYKRLVAIGKSKKKSDAVVAKRLDLDGDEKLSEAEALLLCATARYHIDSPTKQLVKWFSSAWDKDQDGAVTKKEFAEADDALVSSIPPLMKMDANGDGTLTIFEVAANIDRRGDYRTGHHPSQRNPQLWQRALRLTKGKRLSKLNAPKEMREKFNEIDADDSGEIRTIELFNWMLAN